MGLEIRKVFCIGLGKTGTSTFASLMRSFGSTHISGPHRVGSFLARWGEIETLRLLTEQFESFDDYPWPLIYKELSNWYPSAKFVLTVRQNPEAWFKSVAKHYDRRGPSDGWYYVFGTKNPKAAQSEVIAYYNQHNAEVRSWFKDSERFLEICWDDAGAGTALSRFLGHPLGEAPIPKANAAESFRDKEIITRLLAEKQLEHASRYADLHSVDRQSALEFLREQAKAWALNDATSQKPPTESIIYKIKAKISEMRGRAHVWK